MASKRCNLSRFLKDLKTFNHVFLVIFLSRVVFKYFFKDLQDLSHVIPKPLIVNIFRKDLQALERGFSQYFWGTLSLYVLSISVVFFKDLQAFNHLFFSVIFRRISRPLVVEILVCLIKAFFPCHSIMFLAPACVSHFT